MEVNEAIRGRRSIRSYTSKPVSMEFVVDVLEAGTWAPSAKNGQQWRFTVIAGGAKRELTNLFRSELEKMKSRIGTEQMGSSFSSCRIMEEAPVAIMVWNAGERDGETDVHGVAAAVQNMLLQAHSLGLGSLWIGDIHYALEALTRHLSKPWKRMAAVTLGWPASTPKPPPRLKVEQVTEFLD